MAPTFVVALPQLLPIHGLLLLSLHTQPHTLMHTHTHKPTQTRSKLA